MEPIKLHPIQERLLHLAQERNLSGLSLREIGRLVGDSSPQKIKHHLQQLEKRGLLNVDRIKGVIERPKESWVKGFLKGGSRLLRIPIVGSANCGPAEIFADQNIEGFLRISSALLHRQKSDGLFAVRADGFSMNRTKVNNKSIEDGDYLIVDRNIRAPQNGDVVLSVIEGSANVKRFHRDTKHNQIVLMSDSTRDFAPIFIHPQDEFFTNGKVIEVVKRPK